MPAGSTCTCSAARRSRSRAPLTAQACALIESNVNRMAGQECSLLHIDTSRERRCNLGFLAGLVFEHAEHALACICPAGTWRVSQRQPTCAFHKTSASLAGKQSCTHPRNTRMGLRELSGSLLGPCCCNRAEASALLNPCFVHCRCAQEAGGRAGEKDRRDISRQQQAALAAELL